MREPSSRPAVSGHPVSAPTRRSSVTIFRTHPPHPPRHSVPVGWIYAGIHLSQESWLRRDVKVMQRAPPWDALSAPLTLEQFQKVHPKVGLTVKLLLVSANGLPSPTILTCPEPAISTTWP